MYKQARQALTRLQKPWTRVCVGVGWGGEWGGGWGRLEGGKKTDNVPYPDSIAHEVSFHWIKPTASLVNCITPHLFTLDIKERGERWGGGRREEHTLSDSTTLDMDGCDVWRRAYIQWWVCTTVYSFGYLRDVNWHCIHCNIYNFVRSSARLKKYIHDQWLRWRWQKDALLKIVNNICVLTNTHTHIRARARAQTQTHTACVVCFGFQFSCNNLYFYLSFHHTSLSNGLP